MTGGQFNIAGGDMSSVSGGNMNNAAGMNSHRRQDTLPGEQLRGQRRLPTKHFLRWLRRLGGRQFVRGFLTGSGFEWFMLIRGQSELNLPQIKWL